MRKLLGTLTRLDYAVIAITVALVATGGAYAQYQHATRKADCNTPGAEHQLTLNNDKFSVGYLQVKQCDVLKIVNRDSKDYELAFGKHDHHIEYPGFSVQVLGPNEYLMLDTVQSGTYEVHDHLRDNAEMTLQIQ